MSETRSGTSLRGNPFIEETYLFSPDSKEQSKRTCGMCMHRDRNGEGDCKLAEAKKIFGFLEDKEIPKVIDGCVVAQYCPYFGDFMWDDFE